MRIRSNSISTLANNTPVSTMSTIAEEPLYTLFAKIAKYKDPLKNQLYGVLRDIINNKVLGPKATIKMMFTKYDTWSSYIKKNYDVSLVKVFNIILTPYTEKYRTEMVDYFANKLEKSDQISEAEDEDYEDDEDDDDDDDSLYEPDEDSDTDDELLEKNDTKTIEKTIEIRLNANTTTKSNNFLINILTPLVYTLLGSVVTMYTLTYYDVFNECK